MATEVQEYDINSLLKGLTPSESSVGSAKEYDINSLLTELKPFKAESITAGAGATPSNVMKGAEFFARNPIASQAINQPAVKDVGKGIASVLDTTVGSAIPSAVGFVAQPIARLFTSPERAQEITQNITSAIDKPFGKAFGITEDPAYKNEASNRFMQFIGENADKGADWISKQTGLPKADVDYYLNAALTAGGVKATQVAAPYVKAGIQKVGSEFQKAKTNLGMEEQFAAKKAPIQPEAVVPEQTPGGVPGVAPIPKATVEVSQPTAPVVEPAPAPLNPFLQEQVKRAKQAGQEVDPGALNRQNEAMSIDPRLTLTEGQALGDPNLISVERNERGIKEKLVEKFNEQNQILKEKAESYKNQFTPDVKGLSYVENSTHAINAVDDLIGKNESAAKAKYEELKNLGGGKLELDGKTFGTTAREALGAEDIQDFVPSQIMKRIDAYADGAKQMNLNLFESLRTQIARESRKAERAGDGNTVHALSVVRNQLEQMPLANEVGAIKAVADEARGLFKANRDLEANNPFYGQASRGGLDSKDFVPKVAFRSKNDYFASAMEVLDKDPMAKQNFAQGTMDYMIRESTDGSGNLNPMKMANYIDDLQLNNRLEPLFGKEGATELLKFARVSRYTKSTPEGSFVNYSNTAPAGANLIQKYGPAAAEVVGANMGIPFVGAAARKGSEFMQQRKYSKQAAEATKPGAGVVKGKGTKLEDMLKD